MNTRFRSRTRHLIGTLLLQVGFVLFLIAWTLLPVYTMLQAAFTSRSELFADTLWPQNPTLENFTRLLAGGPGSPMPDFWVQLGNSATTAIATTALVLLAALLASYSISRLKPAWGGPVSATALVLYVVPASFLAIPLYLLMGNLGLLESIPGLILALTTIALPYAVWMLRQFGSELPTEIDEAARIDGAGPIRIFVSVYVPLMRTALIPVGMYVFLLSWNDFLYAFLMLTNPAQLTLPIGLSSLLSEEAPWTVVMSAGLIYALPPMLLFLIFRRHMVGGATAGSTTG